MPSLYRDEDYMRASGAPGVDPEREKGRSPFKKDYGRLLHAPSFRRLQGKTQLFPGTESDFFRNRLTHSLEVAQIASGIAERLNVERDADPDLAISTELVEFAALAHDLGHPPFGHNGEKALDHEMRPFGGFEGNAQTLHILAHSERKGVPAEGGGLRDDCGLDLCFRTLASVLKYDRLIPTDRTNDGGPMKGYYLDEKDLVSKIKSKVAPGYDQKFKTIECQIMDLADDIAYSTYDLEDSLHAQFVTPLSLIDALANRDDVRTTVLERTNASLVENSYEQTSVGELLETTAEIFGEAAFTTPLASDETTAATLKSALAGIHYLTLDREITTSSVDRTRFTAQRIGRLIGSVEFELQEEYPALSRVRLTRQALMQVEILKHLNYELVIRSPRLAVVEYRGKGLVHDIFQALRDSGGSLLPDDWKEDFASAAARRDFSDQRVLCDFIAGMTDRYAIEFYSAIKGDGASIFRPL